MKRFLIIGFLLVLSGCSLWEKPKQKTAKPQTDVIFGEISIIPQPASIIRTGGLFELNRETKIVVAAESSFRAANSLNEILFENYGFTLSVSDDRANAENSIVFSNIAANETTMGEEGYSLKIAPELIEISGTERGMFYAIQSLVQLFPLDFTGAIQIPAAEITDAPRFAYRGMHLDVARHFMPPEFIKKYIELLAQYKYNYFHWHLTDDQGWRIEIKKYPRLTEIGSNRRETVVGKSYKPFVGDGIPVKGFYTQEQIRDIVAFAKSKHITVIPEIDMPGHSSAALAAYPAYGCKTNYPYRVQTTWGGFPDVFCPTEETFRFLEDVLGEVMELFPDSPYVHIGGDEVMMDHWRDSAFVRELKRRENLKSEQAIQSWFIRRIEDFVSSRGKKIIGWDEILEEGVRPSATVMAWRGFEPGIKAARAGHNVIMTPADAVYFDHPQGNAALEPLSLGGQITLEDVYKFDPIPKELSPEDANNIIGAQGCVWTEFIKRPKDVEYMAFPRALALAEVLWSKQRVKNFPEFLEKLYRELPRLDRKNVHYRIPKPNGLFDRNLLAGEKMVLDLTVPIADGKIYYTLDGTNPNLKSALYQVPFILDVESNKPVELRAKVVSSNGRESPVFIAKYVRRGNSTVGKNYVPPLNRPEVKKKNGR